MKLVTRNSDISEMDLSARAVNCLKRIKIFTVGDLLDYPEDAFLHVRNLGQKTLNELIAIRKDILDKCKNYRLVDESELPRDEEQQTAPETALLYDMPITELNLSVRALNCLNRVGWTHTSQLVGKTKADLLEIKNMGQKSAEEILAAIDALTFSIPTSKLPVVDTESKPLKKLAEELDSVFGGGVGSWLIKVDQLQKDSPESDRELLLELIHKDPALQEAQKIAICVFLEHHNDRASSGELQAYMISRLIPGSLADTLLSALEADGKIRISDVVTRTYPSAIDFANSLPDEKYRQVLLARFSGRTLEEAALDYGITRERARQIQDKALRHRPKLAEDKYLDVFSKYYFSKEDFRLAFEESETVYHYLGIVTGRKQASTLPLEESLTDESLSVSVRRQIERAVYKQYVTVDGARILKKRPELVRYVVRTYCKDELSYDEFLQVYKMLLEDLGLAEEDSLFLESRTYENKLSTDLNVLWKPGRKLRYYNMEERDFEELLQAIHLEQYEDILISTLLLFRQYPNLMREYDIRDEYELHNLLKKIWGDRQPKINFSRNPTLIFGNGSHEKQAMGLLLQYAPISLQELSEKYEETYGMNAYSATPMLQKGLNIYYHNGVFSLNSPALNPVQFQVMQSRLNGDFYTIRDIRKIYRETFPGSDNENINPYTLKTLGFHVASDYVVSKRFGNATEYFTKLLTDHDITDLDSISKEIQYIGAFSSTLMHLRHQKELVEFEPHRLIHIRRLESGGVTKDKLKDYCTGVFRWTGSDRIFTIQSLRKEGFTHELDDLGFDDWFYSSLLCEDERFTSRRIAGTRVLYSGEKAVTLEDLLIELLLEKEKMEIYSLLSFLEEEYGICLDKEKLTWLIRDSSLYYDNIMETVYIDYDTYYEEI